MPSLENKLILAAGTAAQAPLQFATGPVLTTPAAGAVEFDGDVFSATPEAGNRGVVNVEHLILLQSDYTLTNSVAEQKLFNASANGRLTLPSGRYFFEAMLYLLSMSATSGNMSVDLLGAGTATMSGALYHAIGIDSSSPVNTAATPTHSFSTNPQSAVSIVTGGTGAGLAVSLRGTFKITAGGTIIPSCTLVTAAAAIVKADSFFKCHQVGTASAAVIGAWS